ncbi:MAG: cell division protein FtsZ, partial [Oscillospiraceae bacterium]
EEMEDELKVTVIATGFDEKPDGTPVVPPVAAEPEGNADAPAQEEKPAAAEEEDGDFEAIFNIFNRRK